MFWRCNERLQAAVRQGNAKLVRDGTQTDQLFNLATDLGEAHNLAADDAMTTAPAIHHIKPACNHSLESTVSAPSF